MALVFRDEKGSALTSEEGDANLREVDERITDLETNPPTPVSVSNITETATTFTIWLSNGTSFGPFVKPIATMKFRGEWAAVTGYLANDLVFVTTTTSLYLVTQNHISDDVFDSTLENSGENIYELIIGPLGFATLNGLEDVNFTARSPVHGDLIRFNVQIGTSGQWLSYPETIVQFYDQTTLTLGENRLGAYIICTHASGCTVTVPTQASGFGESILPAGSGRRVQFVQRGGPITVVGAGGVTVQRPTGLLAETDRVGAVIELINVGNEDETSANIWHLYGLLAEDLGSES